MVGDANNARARPHACTSTSPFEIIIPARLRTRMHAPTCTRAPARTAAPACTYRRRATTVYAPAQTAAPTPARTRPHSPARTYPPPALLYDEAHDPRVGFSTHAPARTAGPPPACPQQDPHGPHAGADTSTGASARHAHAPLVRPCTSQHRSMRARAPLVRLRTHGPHDPHAGAGTSTGACARLRRPTALAHTRGPHTYQRARRDGADYGKTPLRAVARTVGPRASGTRCRIWYKAHTLGSGRGCSERRRTVAASGGVRGGSGRRACVLDVIEAGGRDFTVFLPYFAKYTLLSYQISMLLSIWCRCWLPGMIPRLAQLKIFKYEAGGSSVFGGGSVEVGSSWLAGA
ncbi:hypothetical protein GGX14DRAFT_454325 [Mycena pura]|uniref:Uncharacterized protein n=1 Tax=Mycena pura TaxID=153505 RepID=A0AAD6YAC7_9AGAR|nr:hypothetical protein GGX14DRAFT_454325 [Mycena pura]